MVIRKATMERKIRRKKTDFVNIAKPLDISGIHVSNCIDNPDWYKQLKRDKGATRGKSYVNMANIPFKEEGAEGKKDMPASKVIKIYILNVGSHKI